MSSNIDIILLELFAWKVENLSFSFYHPKQMNRKSNIHMHT